MTLKTPARSATSRPALLQAAALRCLRCLLGLLGLLGILVPSPGRAQDEAPLEAASAAHAQASEGAPSVAAPEGDSSESAGVAEGSAEAPRPRTDEAPSGAAAALKTVVLGFSARDDVDPPLLDALTEAVVVEMAKDTGRSTLGPLDVRALLEREAKKQLVGCNEASCLAELAGALNADRVLNGSVERVDDAYLIFLTELDARSSRSVARAQRRVSRAALEASLQSEVRALLGALADARAGGPARVGTVVVSSTPSAEVVVGGRSYGGTPAMIDDAPVGDLAVLLLTPEGELEVEVPVLEGAVTHVDAELGVQLGVSDAELDAYESSTFATSATAVGLAGAGGCCCATTPFLSAAGCLGWGLLASTVGQGWLDAGSPGLFVGLVGSLAAALALFTGGGVALLFLPDEPTPVGPFHVVTLKPPAGAGDERTLYFEPASGHPVDVDGAPPEASAVRGLSRGLAIAY